MKCIFCEGVKLKKLFSLYGETYECENCHRKFNIAKNGETWYCSVKNQWKPLVIPEKVVFT